MAVKYYFYAQKDGTGVNSYAWARSRCGWGDRGVFFRILCGVLSKKPLHSKLPQTFYVFAEIFLTRAVVRRLVAGTLVDFGGQGRYLDPAIARAQFFCGGREDYYG
ncbi:MAG: hypothetical protein HC910_17395 [Spirulinaceae cyanobacterium SM2_1_0]|nr:hypothetical protein [Spirulinaceae cyanobacterium SM2_1_0]